MSTLWQNPGLVAVVKALREINQVLEQDAFSAVAPGLQDYVGRALEALQKDPFIVRESMVFGPANKTTFFILNQTVDELSRVVNKIDADDLQAKVATASANLAGRAGNTAAKCQAALAPPAAPSYTLGLMCDTSGGMQRVTRVLALVTTLRTGLDALLTGGHTPVEYKNLTTNANQVFLNAYTSAVETALKPGAAGAGNATIQSIYNAAHDDTLRFAIAVIYYLHRVRTANTNWRTSNFYKNKLARPLPLPMNRLKRVYDIVHSRLGIPSVPDPAKFKQNFLKQFDEVQVAQQRNNQQEDMLKDIMSNRMSNRKWKNMSARVPARLVNAGSDQSDLFKLALLALDKMLSDYDKNGKIASNRKQNVGQSYARNAIKRAHLLVQPAPTERAFRLYFDTNFNRSRHPFSAFAAFNGLPQIYQNRLILSPNANGKFQITANGKNVTGVIKQLIVHQLARRAGIGYTQQAGRVKVVKLPMILNDQRANRAVNDTFRRMMQMKKGDSFRVEKAQMGAPPLPNIGGGKLAYPSAFTIRMLD